MTGLARLREAAENATPGPWEVTAWDEETDEGEEGCHIIGMGTYLESRGAFQPQHRIRYEHGLYPEDDEQYDEAQANAVFVAAFNPQVALALVEAFGFADHHESCESGVITGSSCSCGWDATRARLLSLLGEDA